MEAPVDTNIIKKCQLAGNIAPVTGFLKRLSSDSAAIDFQGVALAGRHSSGGPLKYLDQEASSQPAYPKRHSIRKLNGSWNGYRCEKIRQLQPASASSKGSIQKRQKPISPRPRSDVSIQCDREPFFQFGRALQRGLGKGKLGSVTLSAKEGVLTVESDWGGSRIPCTKAREISATVSATAFCA